MIHVNPGQLTTSPYIPWKELDKSLEEWWDPDAFPWGAAGALIKHYPDYFDVWWDPDRFSWRAQHTRLLIRHLGHRLTEWWKPDRFPWKSSTGCLIRDLNNDFSVWWEPSLFPWGGMWDGRTAAELLATHCTDDLPQWYDPGSLVWTEELCRILIHRCKAYQAIWAQDALLFRLQR